MKYQNVDFASINDEDVKRCLQEYSALSLIVDEIIEADYNRAIANNGVIVDDEIDKTYEQLVEKYVGPYMRLFRNAEKNGEISEANIEDLRNGLNLYMCVNGAHKHSNYLLKTRPIEDLVIQAEREKINWGIMEDGISLIQCNKIEETHSFVLRVSKFNYGNKVAIW